MRTRTTSSLIPVVLLAILAATLTACGGGSSTTTTTAAALAVSITQGATGSVNDTQSMGLNATVANDFAHAGVSWSVSGTGTLSSQTATSVNYTAPATGSGTDTVTATSNTDHTKSASITISYSPSVSGSISVNISNKFSQVQAGGAAITLNALVQNDTQAQGVNWTLTANGAACSPNCGTLSAATASSAVYTPPASVPASPGNTPVITAASLSDSTKSDSDSFTISSTAANACVGAPSGSESLMNGQYAFLVRGFEGSGAGTPVTIAASFSADGTGKITGGDFDINDTASPQHLTINASGSAYTVGLDPTGTSNLGCVTLANSGGSTKTFHFALGGVSGGVASQGQIIEFDDSVGTGTRAAGLLRLQDASSFSLSKLQPNYAFGVDGWDSISSQWGHYAMAGSFAVDTSGNITNGFADIDDSGTLASNVTGGTGTIGAISTSSGRATLSTSINGKTFGQVIYMINANEFFISSTDAVTANAVASGRAIVTGNSFSNSSLAGNYIVSATGSASGAASVTLGLLNLSAGAVTGTLNSFDVTDHLQTSSITAGTYSVDSASGRVTFTGVGTHAPVAYLATATDGVSAFIVGTDANASSGIADAQASATYSLSSVLGLHYFGTVEDADNTVQNSVGVVALSGTGSVTGSEDSSGQSGLKIANAITSSIAINADGTGNVGTGSMAITNGNRLYFFNGTDAEIFLVSQ